MKDKEEKSIILFDNTKTIGQKEASFYHTKMLNNLVVGSELETQNNNRSFKEKLYEKLQPNQEYGCYNKTGVHSIVSDGSLHTIGNVEIIYAGTNFSTEEMREQLQTIEQAMLSQNQYNDDGTLKNGFYTDTRTGQHISILQVKPFQVPELILRNIYQLTRIFCSNIAYLTATGVGDTPLRSGSLEYARLPNVTAKDKTFKQLYDEATRETGYAKYSFLNLSKNVFNKQDGNIIDEMFFELRVPDRIMCPTIEASLFQLIRAIALKATTISKKGLILAKQDFWNNQKDIYTTLQRKEKTTVEKLIKKPLEEQTQAFLKYLKPEFDKFAPEAYEVLNYLAKNPLWCRKETKDKKGGWEEVEEEYYNILKKHTETTKEKNLILELETGEDFFNNKTKKETINKLSETTGMKTTTIENKLKKYGYVWNNKLKLFDKTTRW